MLGIRIPRYHVYNQLMIVRGTLIFLVLNVKTCNSMPRGGSFVHGMLFANMPTTQPPRCETSAGSVLMIASAGLWKAAALTAHDLRARLAIVHMVHEARGVDVTPSTINKFRMAKDFETVEVCSLKMPCRCR